MSGKVAPLPLDASPVQHGGFGSGKRWRRSRVYKAINDVYEFDGWARIWLAAVWFVLASTTVSYRYPAIAGTYHSTVKALMTSYDTVDGNTADVRTQTSFYGGLTHALGFLTAYADRADKSGHPEGTLPITEYDRILFARLEVDYKSNCDKVYKKAGFSCYTSGIDPATGSQLAPEQRTQLTGTDGLRQIELLNPNVTRDELRTRVAQVLADELLFASTYGFRASLQIGVVNGLAERFMTVYLFTVSRKSIDAIGSQSLRSVVTLIDNVNVRDTPLYIMDDDYRRAVIEVFSLLFLLKAIWDEVVQFNTCRAWRNLHLTDEERAARGSGWRRTVRLLWFYFEQPWNIMDVVTIFNMIAWWICYAVVLAKSYQLKVDTVRSLEDFDEVRSYADLEVQHVVWGVFSAVLVGLRVVPHSRTQAGMNVYLATVKLSWQRLKDLLVFFGYVYFLLVVLIQPLFELTGANVRFKDSGTAILNTALMTFQYMGFQDYFANDAPTFGAYWLIFMFFFWVVVIISVVISQNVLLALVASAYEESREAVGAVEFTEIQLSLYRLAWIVYNRWHCWLLRKSSYTLAEELIAATSRPNVSFYKHVFVRWALADLPETRLLAQLYTDPASEIMYLYSPWAWRRSSPGDVSQQSPWDEQLDYPMYGWEDVPTNEPGVFPRLRCLPPLFSRNPENGRAASRGHLPLSYSEADDLFAMSEEEVEELLECTGWCWDRISRYPLVARFGGMGWSERGRKLLREGLLEVYRRHAVWECTTTSVIDASGGGTPVAGPAPSAAADKGAKGSATPQTPDAADEEEEAATATAGVMQRNRQFSMFNRRGRIADNLDLLWGEVSELRQQQADIKGLLQQLLQQQQQQQQQQQRSPGGAGARGGGGALAAGSVSRGGSAGIGAAAMRGAASLGPASEQPVSGMARTRASWGAE